MRMIRLAALALAALSSIATARPHADWTATVARTAAGSHVMGNPQAGLKLVEYVSYTCSHCAQFHRQSEGALRIAYVARGQLSIEVRHVVRDPVDLTVAMLAHCGAPGRFFQNHSAFLLRQDQWIGTIGRASETQRQRWTTGPLPQRLRAVAADFGFYAIMQQRGYDRTTADRCLADEAVSRRLMQQTADAGKAGVRGTPSFMLGEILLAGTHDWPSLETQIKARLED